MVIAGAVASIAAAAVSAYAAIQQGQAAQATANYNAKIARNQAQAARDAASADAETKRRQYERVLASQRARFGASGVHAEGTPLLVMLESEEEAALDVARIRHGGAVASQGLEAEAKLHRFQGQQARRQSYLQASGSLLQGVSSAATIYSLRGAPTTTTSSATRADYGVSGSYGGGYSYGYRRR